jgi:hypothetical protein
MCSSFVAFRETSNGARRNRHALSTRVLGAFATRTGSLARRARVPAGGPGGTSEGSARNVREVLRLIAEQQATLGKLQQLVVEHVLGENRPDPATGGMPVAQAGNDSVVAAPFPIVIRQHARDTHANYSAFHRQVRRDQVRGRPARLFTSSLSSTGQRSADPRARAKVLLPVPGCPFMASSTTGRIGTSATLAIITVEHAAPLRSRAVQEPAPGAKFPACHALRTTSWRNSVA